MRRPARPARPPRRRLAPRRLVGTVLVALAAALAASHPAPAAARPVTTSHWVAFQDTFQGTTDTVPLAGDVHIVTHVMMNGPTASAIHVYVNLANVTGVGTPSGADYLLLGAASKRFQPEGPPVVDPFLLGFVLMPVGAPPDPIIPPDPITPVPLRIQLSFDADGTLLEAVVTIHVP